MLGNFYMCKQLLLLHKEAYLVTTTATSRALISLALLRKPLWEPGEAGWIPSRGPWCADGQGARCCVWGAALSACPALCRLRCGPAPPCVEDQSWDVP